MPILKPRVEYFRPLSWKQFTAEFLLGFSVPFLLSREQLRGESYLVLCSLCSCNYFLCKIIRCRKIKVEGEIPWMKSLQTWLACWTEENRLKSSRKPNPIGLTQFTGCQSSQRTMYALGSFEGRQDINVGKRINKISLSANQSSVLVEESLS